MEAEELRLYQETVAEILTKTGATATVPALREAGFDVVREDDEPAALAILFELAGYHLTDAPLLDLVFGMRPVIPRGLAVSAVDGSVLHVDGLAVSGGVPAERFAVAGSAEFVAFDGTAAPVRGIDPALGLSAVRARVPLSQVDSLPVGAAAGTAALLRCLASQLIGVGQRMADVATEHVLNRRQFGKPIGVLQTVQHRLADTHVALTAARDLLRVTWPVDDLVTAAVAKVRAASAAFTAAEHAQQLTGALGFTWEFGLHRQVRRLWALDALLGRRDELEEWLGGQLAAAGGPLPVDVAF